MKTLITILLAFLFLSFSKKSYSQMYDSYKGKTIYVKPSASTKKPYSEQIRGFYKTPYENDDPSNVVYPVLDNGHAYYSNRDSLLNKKFKCLAVLDKGVNTFLELQNDKTGIIYFTDTYMDQAIITEDELKNKLDHEKQLANDQENNEIEFKKKVDEYNSLTKDPCLQIDDNYDDFSRTKKINTGYIKPEYPKSDTEYPTPTEYFDVIFYKEKSKSGIIYYMNLSGDSPTPLALNKGVIIILKNKKRLNKPLSIVKTKVNETGDNRDRFIRNSFIKLTQQDIELLKKSPIDSFELYDTQVSESDSDTLFKMFSCLLTK